MMSPTAAVFEPSRPQTKTIEKSSDSPPIIYCTMCSQRELAQSQCATCHRQLCDSCEFAHKMMLCFKTHKVVPLDKTTVEEMPKTDANNNNAVVSVKETIRAQYLEGTKQLENMVKLSWQLQATMKELEQHHAASVNSVNEAYKKYDQILRAERNDIVGSIDAQYNFKQMELLAHSEEIDGLIRNFAFKLSNMNLIFNGDDNNASGLDIATLFKSNGFQYCAKNGPSPSGESDETTNSSLSNLYLDSLFSTQPSGAAVNNFCTELLSLPSVSNPIESGSSVFPPHLPLTDPDSLVPKNINSMQIYKTFGQKGSGTGQFNSPHGFCLGANEDIVVADSSNHRIQIFDSAGRFKLQFGTAGRHDGRLWHPRKVAYLPFQRRYVVCDRGYERSRMQIFSEDGKFLKKVYIQFIDIVAGITVAENEDIVVVDSVTPTVFIIGINDFLRSIDISEIVVEPSDIAVRGKEFYICDFKGHSIVVINEDGDELRRFGSKQTSFPNGIDISLSGDVLVGDSHGNFFHVVVFSKDGQFIAEFRCPFLKVSRCCGLQASTYGRLITVDKNYHHVIVLDTLYVAQN